MMRQMNTLKAITDEGHETDCDAVRELLNKSEEGFAVWR